MKQARGWIPPENLGRVHRGKRPSRSIGADIPRRLVLDHLPEVYDQGAVGSCTAQALAAAVELLAPRSDYAPERPDRPRLYGRSRVAVGYLAEDSGAMLADGVAALRRGWEAERWHNGQWSERWTEPPPPVADDAPRLVSAEALDFDPASIAWELACGHPVAVGLRVTEQWDAPGDVIAPPRGVADGGHAVLLVGYDLSERLWRVRNSWGSSWGDGGYAWLSWGWTAPPWCGEVWSLRAIRRDV